MSGVPLLVGEFGVTSAASMDERAAWTALVCAEAERLGVALCDWGLATEFGAYDRERRRWHESLRAALLDDPPATADEARGELARRRCRFPIDGSSPA